VSVSATGGLERVPIARGAEAVGATYTIQGRPVSLPVEVRDAIVLTAVFVVSAPAVRRLIPTPALHVAEILPGRTLCILAAVEYRDNDLGQYNEVAVNFPVTAAGPAPTPLFGFVAALRRRTLGVYVHWLPVTTSFSRDAGRDIWGFPKTVEAIAFHTEGDRRVCTLAADGAHVLTLSVRYGGRRRLPDMPQDSYAWRDGTLFRTPSVMGGTGVGMRLGGAQLMLGAHPRAEELGALGLPRRALVSTSMERMRARFEAPHVVVTGAPAGNVRARDASVGRAPAVGASGGSMPR
jgi:acetoacetate decarboxylase